MIKKYYAYSLGVPLMADDKRSVNLNRMTVGVGIEGDNERAIGYVAATIKDAIEGGYGGREADTGVCIRMKCHICGCIATKLIGSGWYFVDRDAYCPKCQDNDRVRQAKRDDLGSTGPDLAALLDPEMWASVHELRAALGRQVEEARALRAEVDRLTAAPLIETARVVRDPPDPELWVSRAEHRVEVLEHLEKNQLLHDEVDRLRKEAADHRRESVSMGAIIDGLGGQVEALNAVIDRLLDRLAGGRD